MRIKLIIICFIVVLSPILLFAQENSITTLVESYSNNEDVKYAKVGKAAIWMMKSSLPKGMLDGVKSMTILEFKNDAASSEYDIFRSKALSIFEQTGVECITTEEEKDISIEVYASSSEITSSEYMMFFIHNQDGNEIFMLMGKK